MRGVYQKPEGSGIWWINYYAAGKRHREKVGRKSDAIKLYQLRKADVIAGRKLPELRDSKVVRFSELIDDVLEYVADHKDVRSYVSKAEIVRKAFGSRPAAEITPTRNSKRSGFGHIARHQQRPTATRPSSPSAIGRVSTTTRPQSIPHARFVTDAREVEPSALFEPQKNTTNSTRLSNAASRSTCPSSSSQSALVCACLSNIPSPGARYISTGAPLISQRQRTVPHGRFI